MSFYDKTHFYYPMFFTIPFIHLNLITSFKSNKIETANEEDLSQYINGTHDFQVTYSIDHSPLDPSADYFGLVNGYHVYCNKRIIYSLDMLLSNQITVILKHKVFDFTINDTPYSISITDKIISKNSDGSVNILGTFKTINRIDDTLVGVFKSCEDEKEKILVQFIPSKHYRVSIKYYFTGREKMRFLIHMPELIGKMEEIKLKLIKSDQIEDVHPDEGEKCINSKKVKIE